MLEIIRELIPLSRAEPGNLLYLPHRSPEDPRLFYLYEQYVDEAGYEAHMDSEHFTRLVKEEAIPELLEHRERAFFVTWNRSAGCGVFASKSPNQRPRPGDISKEK